MGKILVPLDGSALADRAVPFAATLAARARCDMVLVRAVNTLSEYTESGGVALKREAQEALNVAATTLEQHGLNVVTRVIDRPPEAAILEAAADPEVGLIVMSTHGRGGLGRAIYGSVADAILRGSPVPVLTVPPHGLPAWPTDRQARILVPLDGSDLSRTALLPACELADLLGASLLLATVVTFPSYASYAEGYVFADPEITENVVTEARHSLEEIAATLRTESRPVEVCATYGTPYFGITNIARAREADLIVIATHGRGGMTRALLGSVATATLRQSEVPVMLVRPATADHAQVTGQPAAQPTETSHQAPAAEDVVPQVTLELSTDELALLTRIVGEWFYDEPVDPRRVEPIRVVLEKLRAARAPSIPSAASDRSITETPVLSMK